MNYLQKQNDLQKQVDELLGLVWRKERRIRELESINADLLSVVDRFIDVCDNAPPVEILQRIGELVEPARATRAKARGEEPPR